MHPGRKYSICRVVLQTRWQAGGTTVPYRTSWKQEEPSALISTDESAALCRYPAPKQVKCE